MLESPQVLKEEEKKESEIVLKKNSLDIVLFETLHPVIKLLNFSASRFSTVIYLQSLFQYDKSTPFFKVKNGIVSSI